MEIFDETKLEQELQKLPAWKRVAFIAQTGTRMIPNYERFSAETGFGDASILRRTLDAVWSWIDFAEASNDLAALQETCEQQAPNTEDFSSRYTSAALDAVNVTATALEATAYPDKVRASEAASLARDTVDLFVQELLSLDPNSTNFEEAINRHDLMQRELQRQREDLDALKSWTGPKLTVTRKLRSMSEERSGSLSEL